MQMTQKGAKDAVPYVPLRAPSAQADELERMYEILSKPRPQIPTYVKQGLVILGDNDWLFYDGDNTMDYYFAANIPTEKELEQMVFNAERLNKYFEAQGKGFVIYIAPNKEEVYYDYIIGCEAFANLPKRCDVIEAYFKKYSDVKVIYPKEEMLAAKEKMQIYFKYDTHWNVAGGYFGSKCLLEALNMDCAEAEFTQISRNTCDLALMLGISKVDDVNYEISYRPEITSQIEQDSEISICTSDNLNGKKMFIMGDSFRENMLPTLSKDFSVIAAFNRNHYYQSTQDLHYYDKLIADSDVIVFEGVERYSQLVFNLIDDYIRVYGL